MEVTLNSKQSEGLANFFFDIAKGLVLGTVGFISIIPSDVKFIMGTLNIALAFAFIRFALLLLEDVK